MLESILEGTGFWILEGLEEVLGLWVLIKDCKRMVLKV